MVVAIDNLRRLSLWYTGKTTPFYFAMRISTGQNQPLHKTAYSLPLPLEKSNKITRKIKWIKTQWNLWLAIKNYDGQQARWFFFWCSLHKSLLVFTHVCSLMVYSLSKTAIFKHRKLRAKVVLVMLEVLRKMSAILKSLCQQPETLL